MIDDGLRELNWSYKQGRNPANSYEKLRIFLNILNSFEFTWIRGFWETRDGPTHELMDTQSLLYTFFIYKNV